jgi:hypothetical protein
MSRPPVKWSQLRRYCERHGYEIRGRGGDKKISAPKTQDPKRTRQQVVIGHTSCSRPGAQVLDGYLNLIERAFGITREDIHKG